MTLTQTITAAILWQRPAAMFVLQGTQLDPHLAPNGDPCAGLVWAGPGDKPTTAEVTQWVQDYLAQRIDKQERAERELRTAAWAALLDVLSVRLNVPRATLRAEFRAAYLARLEN